MESALRTALTFDDVLLVPALSEVLPGDVSLKARLTRSIWLNIPLLSAAMDTVTDARMAIAIAQEGGVGVIHKNMSPKKQAEHVAIVKRFESGVLKDPITIPPDMQVREVLELTRREGFSGLPVVENEKVVGIVTNRDLRFEARHNQPVRNIMTPQQRLVTVREGCTADKARDLMHKHRLERVLVVDENMNLRGLITVKDLLKSREHPLASKDSLGRLRVGAAVGTSPDTEERIECLAGAGVDFLVLDTAHGHSRIVLEQLSWIKQRYPDLEVIGGNIATEEAARDLLDKGADAVKVWASDLVRYVRHALLPGSACRRLRRSRVWRPRWRVVMCR